MIKWQMLLDENQPLLGFKSAWTNFSNHASKNLASSRIKKNEYLVDRLKNQLKQELIKWQASLTDHPLIYPWSGEWYLEFPDEDSVTAFELAWS